MLEWTVYEVRHWIRSLNPEFVASARQLADTVTGRVLLSTDWNWYGGPIDLSPLESAVHELRVFCTDPAIRAKTVVKLKDLSQVTNRGRIPNHSASVGGLSNIETATYCDRKVMIKTLKSDSGYECDIKQFRTDIVALKALKSYEYGKFVVELIAYCERPLALVMENCEGGTLFSYRVDRPKLTWRQRMECLNDVTCGLLAIHKRPWEGSGGSKYFHCCCVALSSVANLNPVLCVHVGL